jgi:hypothetical protein
VLPTSLGDEADEITTQLEEPPVEGDEGAQLLDRFPGEGHAGILASIYAGSVNRMELVHAEELASG